MHIQVLLVALGASGAIFGVELRGVWAADDAIGVDEEDPGSVPNDSVFD